jgi:hypothetical protein
MTMRLFLTLLCFCIATPAIAGQRAVYHSADDKPLTIEVADSGNAIVRQESADEYGILRDGRFYIASRKDDAWKVASIEDTAAAFDQVLPPIFGKLFGALASAKQGSTLRIEPRGSKSVAGLSGQEFAVYGLDEEKPDAPDMFVLSKDPALAPVGKAMEQFLISTMVAMRPLLGEMAAAMAADMRAIFAHGAPLDASGKFRLVSLSEAEVPESALALPAEPMTVAEIVAEMRASAAAE